MVRLRHATAARGSWQTTTAAAVASGSGTVGTRRSVTVSWERLCILLLLGLAWAWIMATFGVVFYHGYYKKKVLPAPSTASTDALRGLADNTNNHHKNLEQQIYDPHPPVSIPGQLAPYESPLLIFTCSRDEYLRQTLDDILQYIPKPDDNSGNNQNHNTCLIGCPIIISQDGNVAAVVTVIQEYQLKFQQINIPLIHLRHKTALRGGRGIAAAGTQAYQALAVHYGWALQQVFDEAGTVTKASGDRIVPQRVIILEEDLHIAPDFFSYFAATAPLLDTDSTLLAVSAFNDNGFKDHVLDAKRLLRSDFFPGLGWMMNRKLWTNELQIKWPKGYWDDWLRDPAQRQNRQIIRPELSRTYHFGVKGGASLNQFGGKLSSILLNPTPVDWSHEDLTYLRIDEFDRKYWNAIHAARHADHLSQVLEMIATSDVQLDYHGMTEFQTLAQQLGIMDDEKAGILRTSYKRVIEFRPSTATNHLLFLTPPIEELQKEFLHVL